MGYFEIYGSYEDMIEEKNCLSRWKNAYVATGKAFALDFMFGIRSWIRNPDYPASSDEQYWYTKRYIRVGTSTDTNTGIVGPTDGSNTPVDGPWQGVSQFDWKLSADAGIDDMEMTVKRAGNTVHCFATLSSDLIDDIYEIGIFLGNGTPSANPLTSVSDTDRANAMIVRSVNVNKTTDGTEFVAVPEHKVDGQDKYIKYIFDDFERGG